MPLQIGLETHIQYNCSMKIEDNSVKAIIRLGAGDMRKNLNILQAASMAFSKQTTPITEDQVYDCTGNPSPADVHQILQWLLNESFESAFDKINQMKVDKGYALQDILTNVAKFSTRLAFDDDVSITLFKKLSDIEYRLASGANERIQSSALVGAFQVVREQVAAKVAGGSDPDAMQVS
jgi:replication factor C subunit 3/5